jgi:hypothetical protein
MIRPLRLKMSEVTPNRLGCPAAVLAGDAAAKSANFFAWPVLASGSTGYFYHLWRSKMDSGGLNG